MNISQLQKKFLDHQDFMFLEGILDDQFVKLQKQQDVSSPNFVLEVVTVFFDDSQNVILKIAKALEQPVVDFEQIDAHVHQCRGSSASIGALRVQNVCASFKNFCEARNAAGCKKCLEDLLTEWYQLKKHFEILFQLQREIQVAGGSIPNMSRS